MVQRIKPTHNPTIHFNIFQLPHCSLICISMKLFFSYGFIYHFSFLSCEVPVQIIFPFLKFGLIFFFFFLINRISLFRRLILWLSLFQISSLSIFLLLVKCISLFLSSCFYVLFKKYSLS